MTAPAPVVTCQMHVPGVEGPWAPECTGWAWTDDGTPVPCPAMLGQDAERAPEPATA